VSKTVGGHQPTLTRVLGLHGHIDGTRPLRIGDTFRSELGKDEVTPRKVKAGRCTGCTPQSLIQFVIRLKRLCASVRCSARRLSFFASGKVARFIAAAQGRSVA
jgi:hypothetical protein